MYDLTAVRALFPITETHAYLNNAGIGPLSTRAHAAGVAFLDERMRDPWPEPAPTALIRLAQRKNHVRRLFADLIGAPHHTVGLTESTSAGENIVVKALTWRPGDNVVLDDLHYESSLLIYRELAKRHGVEIRMVHHVDGRITPDQIAAVCDNRTRMVSIAWVSNRNGFRHDVAQIATIAHQHGAYLFVDAIQAVGTFAMDVVRDGIDFLSCGSYKWLYSNFGVSFLYVNEALLPHIPSDRFGHTHITSNTPDFSDYTLQQDGRKFEYAAIAHTSLAQIEAGLLLLHELGITHIEQHSLTLTQSTWQRIHDLGYQMFTPPNTRSAIVAFVPRGDATLLEQRLAAVQVSCMLREGNSSVRLGIGLFNTTDDIDRLIDVLKQF